MVGDWVNFAWEEFVFQASLLDCHISFFVYKKNDNGKLWVEVIIVTSLDAVATVDVLAANNNDVNLVETRNVLFVRLLNRRLVLIA